MLTFISRALSENGSDNPSTMRLCTLLIVLAIMGGFLFTSIKSGTLPALSQEQVALVLGALGMKAWQRGKEGEPAK